MALSAFLENGLLDVGDDNSKLSYLQKSSDDLSKRLVKDKRALLEGALLLLEKDLPEENSVVSSCRDALTKHWPTYRSRFPEDASQLFRAILTSAVMNIAQSDIGLSVLVLYALEKPLALTHGNPEQKLITSLLQPLAARVEQASHTAWARPETLSIPEVQYTAESVPTVTFDSANFASGVLKASASVDEAGNTFSPHANQVEWAQTFSKGLAETLRANLSAVSKAQNSKLRASWQDDFKTAVNSILPTVFESGAAGSKRMDLIYWRQTLYSKTTKSSYRGLPLHQAALIMSVELAEMVATPYPHSVEYFLAEALRDSHGDDSLLPATPHDHLNATRQFASVLPQSLKSSDNHLLLDLLTQQEVALNANSTLRLLSVDATITASELARWFFRDIHIKRLLTSK